MHPPSLKSLFTGLLLLALGVTAVVDALVFDLSLPRFRVHVPSLLRDLLRGAAFVVVAMGVLRKSGVNVMSLITTSAVLTAVVGLAHDLDVFPAPLDRHPQAVPDYRMIVGNHDANGGLGIADWGLRI